MQWFNNNYNILWSKEKKKKVCQHLLTLIPFQAHIIFLSFFLESCICESIFVLWINYPFWVGSFQWISGSSLQNRSEWFPHQSDWSDSQLHLGSFHDPVTAQWIIIKQQFKFQSVPHIKLSNISRRQCMSCINTFLCIFEAFVWN